MTKWIVSTPLKGTNLMKNFVCFTEVELIKLLEQYPDASVEMKDSHLEDHAPLPLTDDQQVVLEWLKSNLEKGNYPMMAIVNMQNIDEGDPCFYAYENMTTKEDWEVLAAFAEWGISGD